MYNFPEQMYMGLSKLLVAEEKDIWVIMIVLSIWNANYISKYRYSFIIILKWINGQLWSWKAACSNLQKVFFTSPQTILLSWSTKPQYVYTHDYGLLNTDDFKKLFALICEMFEGSCSMSCSSAQVVKCRMHANSCMCYSRKYFARTLLRNKQLI